MHMGQCGSQREATYMYGQIRTNRELNICMGIVSQHRTKHIYGKYETECQINIWQM